MDPGAASRNIRTGRRLALYSVMASGGLAILDVGLGLLGGSTSVVAAGVEFSGDVLSSLIVLAGMQLASRPPDEDHPYGHGRFEILAGFMVGIVLLLAGCAISYRSLGSIGAVREAPHWFTVWPLVISMAIKSGLAGTKFRVGRQIGSASLVADAWNDAVDILSSGTALGALLLTLFNPSQFLAADQYGGVAVGLIVILTGMRVVRDTSLELSDTMPDSSVIDAIRKNSMEVAGVRGVEKCFARKTGLQYHVDLHVEVDPEMTVAVSHDIATEVRAHLRARIPAIADVLVHIEPSGL